MSHTSRKNVDNITQTHKFTPLNNRNESKIIGMPNYNENPNNNMMNHIIEHQQRNRESTNKIIYKYRNKVYPTIKEHGFDKLNNNSNLKYESDPNDSDNQDHDIMKY